MNIRKENFNFDILNKIVLLPIFSSYIVELKNLVLSSYSVMNALVGMFDEYLETRSCIITP